MPGFVGLKFRFRKAHWTPKACRAKGYTEIWTGGIDWGPHVHRIWTENDLQLWHIPGHRYWSGIGNQSYCESRYLLVRLIDGYPDDGRVELLDEREAGRNWRSVKAEMIATMREGH